MKEQKDNEIRCSECDMIIPDWEEVSSISGNGWLIFYCEECYNEIQEREGK